MNPICLDGKTAVITGGGRGLGAGITRAMLEAGADVVVISRSDLPGDLVDLAATLDRKIRHQSADFEDPESVSAAAATILADTEVDILVNNAGTQERHPSTEFPLESWNRVIQVNLTAVFQLCQAFGAPMVQRGSGKIINLASLLSFQGGLTVPAYAAAKGGVAQLTKALCNEWSSRGVNVNAIAPGYMDTEMNTALLADPVRHDQILSRIPAGRWGGPADVGGTAVFLASSAADYVHGQIIAVDGGWMAR
jgi:Dehydrogenases with different specificities (related to short-chain alcohol dehydrogenases)